MSGTVAPGSSAGRSSHGAAADGSVCIRRRVLEEEPRAGEPAPLRLGLREGLTRGLETAR